MTTTGGRWRAKPRWARCAGAGLVLLAGVASAVTVHDLARGLWYGAPYPAADPDAVAVRLQDRSQRAFDAIALPEPVVLASNELAENRSCRTRGLRAVTRWDAAEPGVVSLTHRWSVADLPEGAARAAMERLRGWAADRGWEFTADYGSRAPGSVTLGHRFEDPAGGDRIDAQWHSSGSTLLVQVFSPCARVPAGHPGAGTRATWTPTTPS